MTSPSPALGSEGPAITLLDPLGVGRTSRVWRGRLAADWTSDGSHLDAGTEVAVKILREELASDMDARVTLSFERDASRAVHHPSLARTRYLDLEGPTPPLGPDAPRGTGKAPSDSERADCGAMRPWLMLDLVPGSSLDETLQREGPMAEPYVRATGASIARALSALHAAGWVHGDVKPANVRLDDRRRAVLVDLGFARRTGAKGAPLGTPAYLAPERTAGGKPRASADLFALGVLLYETLTGEHPAGPDLHDPGAPRLQALRRGQVRPPSDLLPRVSPLLDSLVRALLNQSPDARPTARETAQILELGEASEWWRSRIAFDPGVRRDTVAWSGQHGLPIVGRAPELARLDETWAKARTGGMAVLLTGEQGAGKSRLIAEFAHRVRLSDSTPPLYLYARCDSVGDERPGAPLISLLRRWLHLPSPGTPGPRTQDLLTKTVAPDIARALVRSLQPGQDQGEADISEAAALAEWVVRLSSAAPTIIFVDDVNFAGRATLKALVLIARELKRTNLLLILGLRQRAEIRHAPELAEVRARLSERIVRVPLGPLDEDSVLELVEHLFHHSVPRLRLARTLLDRTQGLPGSIGELLRLAGQKGWTRPAPPPTRGLELLVPPETLPRPTSIRKAVAERLDELPARARIWLERLAVVGARVDPSLAALAWPRADALVRDDSITTLIRAGWLVPAGSRYRFSHPVDREETLARMSARRERRAHAALGVALTAREDAVERRPSYRRAFHLKGAGLHQGLLAMLPSLLDELREGGHPYRRATVAGWGLQAIDESNRASDPAIQPLRRMLLEELADAADRLGEREEQRAALDALGELPVDQDQEPQVAARIYLLHARLAVSSGELALARGLLANAKTLFVKDGARARTPDEAAQDRLDHAEVARLSARIEAEQAEFKKASRHAAEALELAPNDVARAEAHLLLAEIEIHDGRLESALRRLRAARRALRGVDGGLRSRATRATGSLIAGRTWRLIGRPYRAARAFETAAELASQAGEGRIEVEVAARRGRLLADVKREHEAELVLRDALFTARRIEDRRGEALVALFLGILLGENGERGAADLVYRATALAQELGQGRIEALAAAIEARIAIGDGDVSRALKRSAHGWDLVRRHGAELPDRIVIGGTRALALELAKRDSEAERMIKTIRRRLESDNARLQSKVSQQRHRRWSVALLASALSPDGPLYPRALLREH